MEVFGMGTLTAQILVGRSHPNHGGINPTHYLFLSENSRPVWTLVEENIYRDRSTYTRRVLISTVENMLEDGLLQVGLHVVKDPELVLRAQRFPSLLNESNAEMYRDVDPESREQLYELCRRIESRYKIVLSVFEGSTIMKQLPVLRKYSMDVEVCTPQFIREYSSWTDTTWVRGNLDIRTTEV
jgi:hypothetical protein